MRRQRSEVLRGPKAVILNSLSTASCRQRDPGFFGPRYFRHTSSRVRGRGPVHGGGRVRSARLGESVVDVWNERCAALYNRTFRVLYDAGIGEKPADELAMQCALARRDAHSAPSFVRLLTPCLPARFEPKGLLAKSLIKWWARQGSNL